MDNKKVYISYTSEAEKAFEALTGDLKKRIEDFLIKEKYVTGDSEIEITVSDIERIKNRITIQSDPKREKKFLLLGYTYIIVGIMFFLIAFFWDDIEYMFMNDKINGILGLMGLGITLFGLMLVFAMSVKTSNHISEIEDLNKKYTKYYNETINIKQFEKIAEIYDLLLKIEEKKNKEKKTEENKNSVKLETK
ncbi:hypothetical protein [uncultured Bacteroides sp.]|uniref:hypothetical protein n=1 Tax=uncultured Bacteroides sp. TaxID=162156 RepID=UPI00280B8F8F|nr:hypothetical protein [uncultured Bacteroides sp.]